VGFTSDREGLVRSCVFVRGRMWCCPCMWCCGALLIEPLVIDAICYTLTGEEAGVTGAHRSTLSRTPSVHTCLSTQKRHHRSKVVHACSIMSLCDLCVCACVRVSCSDSTQKFQYRKVKLKAGLLICVLTLYLTWFVCVCACSCCCCCCCVCELFRCV